MADDLTPEFKRELLEKLGAAAVKHIRPKIKSKTLRAALRFEVDQLLRGVDLFVPHYWAIYLHDGRGVVRPKRASVLVWFPNIRNDPRVAGGLQYPIRVNQIRKLTKAQFRKGLELNKTRPKDDPYMVIAMVSGPTKRPQNPFFKNGLKDFIPQIDTLVEKALDRMAVKIAKPITIDINLRL